MQERGVIYTVWGNDPKFKRALDRSIASVKRHHPELPIEVLRLDASDPIKGLLEKARMADLSPFEETLYLDTDTVVLGRLDFAFEKARRFGLACAICECPWARRYGGVDGDLVEYNTGVLFFNKKAKPVFDAWQQLAPAIDSSIKHVGPKGEIVTMPFNDQAAFAKAIDDLDFRPFILPMNWNLRPVWQRAWFGPVRIWHDFAEVPDQVRRVSDSDSKDGAIIQFRNFW